MIEATACSGAPFAASCISEPAPNMNSRLPAKALVPRAAADPRGIERGGKRPALYAETDGRASIRNVRRFIIISSNRFDPSDSLEMIPEASRDSMRRPP